MGYLSKSLGLLTALIFVATTVAMAEELEPLKARVPADQMGEAKAHKNPAAATPENIAKGKALYEGKGTCFNCHGKEGKGDGPAGAILNPTPRNFTNCKFHKKRTDGEMMWVMKNGSKGPANDPKPTGMVSLVPGTISEEEAWAIINYERSFCKKGE
jgi:mono/diheme cytochrome c family protein